MPPPSLTLIFGSLTRISDLHTRPFEIGSVPRSLWATGDYVVGRYVGSAEGNGREVNMELSDGSLQALKINDLVVGALGDRAATNEVVGTWQLIDDASHPALDMLCGSGIFGIETSRCSQHPRTPKFIYEGHCLRMDKKICMKDFGPQVNTTQMPRCPMILIVGSSMSSGKTYTGRAIIDIIKNNIGVKKVAAAKFTGAGYNHDANQFSLAGADFVCDFVDAGFPSTVIPAEEYRKMALPRMLGMLAEQKPDCVVAEVGASPFEAYNGVEVLKELLVSGALPANVCLMICANDAYGVLGLKQVLASEGLTNLQPDNILGVSGLAACNSAGVALVERVSGLRAFNMKDPVSMTGLRMLLEKRFFC